MSYVNWEIKAREFANCNCAYGCPCQFNALPTDGTCRAAVGFLIDQGHSATSALMASARPGSTPGPARCTRATAPCN